MRSRRGGIITLQGVITAGQSAARMAVMRSHVYEITFMGRAGAALRTEFEDCEVTLGPDSTTLRADLPDQAALHGLLYRIGSFGLELTQLQMVTAESTCRVEWRGRQVFSANGLDRLVPVHPSLEAAVAAGDHPAGAGPP
jgi:hypothetical protein